MNKEKQSFTNYALQMQIDNKIYILVNCRNRFCSQLQIIYRYIFIIIFNVIILKTTEKYNLKLNFNRKDYFSL